MRTKGEARFIKAAKNETNNIVGWVDLANEGVLTVAYSTEIPKERAIANAELVVKRWNGHDWAIKRAQDLANEVVGVKQQRDDLLAACEDIVNLACISMIISGIDALDEKHSCLKGVAITLKGLQDQCKRAMPETTDPK
jgi:hypothetical protein